MGFLTKIKPQRLGQMLEGNPLLLYSILPILHSVLLMSNFFLSGLHDKEANQSQSFSSPQKGRQSMASPFREGKQEHAALHLKSPTSPSRLNSNHSSRGSDNLPPRAVPFRRSSRNSSRDHIEQTRQQSANDCSRGEVGFPRESLARLKSLQKRAHQQAAQKEKWRSLSSWQEQQIKRLSEDVARARQERISLNAELIHLKETLLTSQRNLLRANQTIETLNKTLKECRINQKSMANLKNLQNQIDLLQQRNNKLSEENQQLAKSNKVIGLKMQQRDSTSQSQADTKKDQQIKSLQIQLKRLKEQLQKGKSERQLLLQGNLRELQRKLYDKQGQIRKISIHLNYLDRKKYISIDEVKTKKDQEIKDLRQRFMKVSRDLKETKDKMQQGEKKKPPKEKVAAPRRVKSSKLLGAASESEQLTFELSSEI